MVLSRTRTLKNRQSCTCPTAAVAPLSVEKLEKHPAVSCTNLSLGPGGGGRTSPAAAGGVGSLFSAAVPGGRNRPAARQTESAHRHLMSRPPCSSNSRLSPGASCALPFIPLRSSKCRFKVWPQRGDVTGHASLESCQVGGAARRRWVPNFTLIYID